MAYIKFNFPHFDKKCWSKISSKLKKCSSEEIGKWQFCHFRVNKYLNWGEVSPFWWLPYHFPWSEGLGHRAWIVTALGFLLFNFSFLVVGKIDLEFIFNKYAQAMNDWELSLWYFLDWLTLVVLQTTVQLFYYLNIVVTNS